MTENEEIDVIDKKLISDYITDEIKKQEIEINSYFIHKDFCDDIEVSSIENVIEKVLDFNISVETYKVTIEGSLENHLIDLEDLSNFYFLTEEQYSNIIFNNKKVDVKRKLESLNELVNKNKLFLEKCLESVYPNEWIIEESFNDTFNEDEDDSIFRFRVIIHFPKITVINSNHKTHNIYDVFVKFEFDKNLKLIETIELMRTTLNELEFYHEYSFSHTVRSKLDCTFNKCCFGSGTEISIMQSEMSIPHNTLTEEYFCLFLHFIKTYLSWESLEGGPYIRISSLSYSSNVNKKEVISAVVDLLKTNTGLLSTLKLRFDYNKHEFEVLKSSIKHNSIFLNNRIINSNKTEMISNRENIKKFMKKGTVYNFGNRNFPLNVIVDEINENNTLISDNVVNIIAETINKYVNYCYYIVTRKNNN